MKLFFLEVIRVISQEGSFSQAAAVLGCSQSNISYAVGEMEKFLGKRIFQRGRSGCLPTVDGAEAIRRIRLMLNMLDELKSDEVQGRVRIKCTACVNCDTIERTLSVALNRYPRMQVAFTRCADNDEAAHLLRRDAVDIAIVSEPLVGGDFVEHHCWPDDYVLVSPYETTLSQASSPTLLQKALHDIVLRHDHLAYAHPQMRQLASMLQEIGLFKRPRAEIGNADMIASLVSKGLGFSVMPRRSLSGKRLNISARPLPGLGQVGCYLVGPPVSLLSNATRAVVSLLKHSSSWSIAVPNEAVMA